MKRSRIIVCLSVILLLLMAVMVGSQLTPYGSATSPDSLKYLDIAKNLKDGKGFFTTDFSLEHAGVHALIEERSWPPLYPWLLSRFIKSASDVSTVSGLSRILLFLTILFAFLITYRINVVSALLSSLLLAITVPIITIYTYVWSETLFLPILMAFAWAVITYLESEERAFMHRAAILFIVAMLMILLAYTRYIGIAFAVFFPILYGNKKRDAGDRMMFSVAIIIYTMAVGTLLYKNYAATGSISGAVRLPSDKTIVENVIDVYYTVLALVPTSLALPGITAILSFLAVVGIQKTRCRMNRAERKHVHHRVMVLSLLGIVYLIAIIALRTHSRFDRLDIRLLSPVFLAVYVLIVLLPAVVNLNSKTGLAVVFLSVGLILASALHGYREWITSSKNWKAFGTPLYHLNTTMIYNNFTKPPGTDTRRQLFSALIPEGSMLVTDNPLIWEFTTGVPCVQKPQTLDQEQLRQINQLPDGSFLLLAPEEMEQLNTSVGPDGNYDYLNLGTMTAVRLPIYK